MIELEIGFALECHITLIFLLDLICKDLEYNALSAIEKNHPDLHDSNIFVKFLSVVSYIIFLTSICVLS